MTALIAAVLPALDEVVGAEDMHRVLRHWLVELGHDDYRDGAQVTVAGGGGSPPASR